MCLAIHTTNISQFAATFNDARNQEIHRSCNVDQISCDMSSFVLYNASDIWEYLVRVVTHELKNLFFFVLDSRHIALRTNEATFRVSFFSSYYSAQ